MITKYHLEHIVLTGAKDKKNKSKALLFIKIDCTMIFKHFGPVDLLTTTHSVSLFIEFTRFCQQKDARLIITGTRERSGSVVECLTRDRRAAGSSLTGVTALWSLSKTHYPSLVLVQPRKNRPCLTE